MKETLSILTLIFLVQQDEAKTKLPLVIPHTNSPAAIDVYHLGSVIEAEAIGEPCRCQLLVGEVWENRGKKKAGFKSKKPSAEALRIARKVLTSRHEHSLNYFFNPSTSTDFKFLRYARKFKLVRCGKQKFFSDGRKIPN